MPKLMTISKKYGPTILTMGVLAGANMAGATTADIDPASIFDPVKTKALAVIAAAGVVAAAILPVRAGLKIIVGWAKGLVGMAK